MNGDEILPIPAATMKRYDGRWHDAARMYIHQRQTCLKDIAKLTGLHATRLSIVRREDGWDDFTAKLAAKSMPTVFSRNIAFERSEEQTNMMAKEVKDQVAVVEKLWVERDRITKELVAYVPGTKLYTGALTALALVRREIEAMTGLDDLKSEVSSMRAEKLKKSRENQPSAGRIVDLG